MYSLKEVRDIIPLLLGKGFALLSEEYSVEKKEK